MPALDTLPFVGNFWSCALGAVIALCSMTTWIRVARHRARAKVLDAYARVIDAQTRQIVTQHEQARLNKSNEARLALEQHDMRRIDKLGEAHLAELRELIERWRSEPELFPRYDEAAE